MVFRLEFGIWHCSLLNHLVEALLHCVLHYDSAEQVSGLNQCQDVQI